ncbi:cyclic-guanylate-specific phosphodiesterase [uncultured Pantoea sp.]|uniref:cyclic-guanylate-specific phosphodiesterase n=1 Tax=uncultured Pantoea sp. TaxID=218084 RepID=UPI0025F5152E|nr:cyclic-guanylate-specific phosphodiesterase [uncultured Pantoea sp.]
MVMESILQRLPSSTDLNHCPGSPLFWQQCQRHYRFQPIYRVSGRLLAIELLTAVAHPAAPDQPLSPEAWFAGLDVAQRLNVVHEQLDLLTQWSSFFERHAVMASVNIDGPSLLAIQHRPAIRRLIARLPWLRFELTEHQVLPQPEKVAKITELGPLWLDDFGSGMANFSALTELQYDYIKLSRDLFMLLDSSDEGRGMYPMLLALINRYCNGVIVEGVETEAQWQQVKASSAIAAQGYYFSRPVPFPELNHLTLQLP